MPPPAQPVAPPPATQQPAPPFAPPPIQPPVAAPPVQQPVAQPPAAAGPTASAGGFSWGLTPSSESPAPQPPAPHDPAPASPEPAPFVPPTPPPAPYVPPAAPAQPVPPFDPPPVALPAAAPTTAFPFEPTVQLPAEPPAQLPAEPIAPAQPVQFEPTIAFPQQQLEPQHPIDATQWLAAPLDASLDGATEVLEAELVGVAPPVDESLEPSALDSLFGEGQFADYEGQSMIQVPPRPPRDGKGKKPREPMGPIPRNQKILMWVAGGLVAALALVALFMLGTRLAQLQPAPAVAPSPTPSASATGSPVVLGPVEPGEYVWDELLGGECLEPWESAWQDRYTVVDCTKPNTAQMVHKGEFDDLGDAPYPGVEELSKRINLLCTAPTIIDYAVAGAAKDIQVTASFAADAEDWNDGNRTYYCFVNRSSGEQFTSSISLPQVAPTPTPLPTP